MDGIRTIANGTGYAPAPQQPMPGGGEELSPAPVESQAPATRTPERSENRDTLSRAVEEINASVSLYRRHLGIRHHEPTNRRIVTVYDSETNEVIREIPPESVLEAHANMLEMVGLFVNTRG